MAIESLVSNNSNRSLRNLSITSHSQYPHSRRAFIAQPSRVRSRVLNHGCTPVVLIERRRKQAIERAHKFMDEALEESTRDKYDSQWKQFETYCAKFDFKYDD